MGCASSAPAGGCRGGGGVEAGLPARAGECEAASAPIEASAVGAAERASSAAPSSHAGGWRDELRGDERVGEGCAAGAVLSWRRNWVRVRVRVRVGVRVS